MRQATRLRTGVTLVLAIIVPTIARCREHPPARGGTGTREAAARSADINMIVSATVSSDWLRLLPDGEMKRRFLLDCAGCHQFDASIAMSSGTPRSRQSWVEKTQLMLSFAGASSGFPIMSPSRDADATADWLVTHLSARSPQPAPATPAPTDIEIIEYDLPRAMDLPHDVALDSAGRLVVTGMFSHVMYVLDPATGVWSEVAIPIPDANPRSVEIDADGAWWIILGQPQKLARFDPSSGEWRTFDLGVYPHETARDAAGRVWFNGHFTKDPEILGYVDPATGARRSFEVPSPTMPDGGSTIPYGLRVGPDGDVWMTELVGGRLVRFDPETEKFELYDLPTSYSGPRRLDVGPDGTVWIPEFANNRLARFDPATESFAEYVFPTPDVLPYVARVDRRSGFVWIATAAGDLIARFDPDSEKITEYRLPTPRALVRHIDIDSRTGDVWGAYGAAPPTAVKVFRIRAR